MDNPKFFSTIAGASILLTITTLGSKGLGFLREILFASYFGTGSQFDIYLVGAALPMTISTIVFYISQNYLIPLYYKRKKELSELEAESFIFQSLLLFLVSSFLLAFILFLFSDNIISFYLGRVDDVTFSMSTKVFNLFLITIPLQAGFSVFANYLTAKYEYTHPAVSILFVNIILIIFIILFNSEWGIYSIVIGFLAGNIIQFIYILLISAKSITFRVKSNFLIEGFTSSFILIIFIETVSQVFIIADRYFYNNVEPGGISAINYATTLYLLPLSILSAGLATALFPKFSESYSNSNLKSLFSYLSEGLLNNTVVFIPISVFIYFNSESIIELIFQRGRFSSQDTLLTAEILKILSVSLIFASSYAILNKFLYAAEKLKLLAQIGLFVIILKVSMNFLLVGLYAQNGLAVSSSLSYSIMGILGLYLANNQLNQPLASVIIKNSVLLILAAILCYGLVEILFNSVFILNYFLLAVKLIIFIIAFFVLVIKLGFGQLHSIITLNKVFIRLRIKLLKAF